MTDLFKEGDDLTKGDDPDKTTQTTDGDVLAQKLSSITNEEGKPKYADMNVALDALKSSQEYIPGLQQKLKEQEETMAEMKLKLEQTSSVEEVVQKLLDKQTDSNNTADQQVQKGLDEDSVLKLVQNVLTTSEKQKVAQTNVDQVASTLTEAFGDNARDEIKKVAEENGTTPQKLEQLAAESPNLVLSLFKQKTQSTPLTEGDVNTNTFKKVDVDVLSPPEKSMLSGATSKEQADYWRQVKKSVHKKYEVVEN